MVGLLFGRGRGAGFAAELLRNKVKGLNPRSLNPGRGEYLAILLRCDLQSGLCLDLR